ncbi:potassium channel family protein [Methyloligella sp. 2.7D]|uniref:potassium channel family protein n=1 Tax=unclassified Methyloligella TaxID=2625955 RepID=UPI00157D5C5F|nr:potassium channel family protein [Methyloligella sp. GL2]QKP78563.1 two pore domain potassium channel family protein [Methyloligella sp. GL2]
MLTPGVGLEATWDELMVGGGTSAVNLVIHSVLLAVIVHTAERIANRSWTLYGWGFSDLIQRSAVIITTGVLLVIAHYVEVRVWALTYEWVDAAPPNTPLVYFAFSNYTTLGYGDIVPVDEWRLLGPITALNGVMLISWSTALVYAVLQGTGVMKIRGGATSKRDQAP